MKKSDPLIIVEAEFGVSLERVWSAITQATEMRQWFFEQILSFKPELGFQTEFAVSVEDRTFTHMWQVVEVHAPHKIKYQWRYKEYSGDSMVTFELKEENGKTKLKLIPEVLEDFPSDVPEFKRESCIGAWDYFIKESLKQYLES